MRFETGTEEESDWLLAVSRLEDSAGWMDGWMEMERLFILFLWLCRQLQLKAITCLIVLVSGDCTPTTAHLFDIEVWKNSISTTSFSALPRSHFTCTWTHHKDDSRRPSGLYVQRRWRRKYLITTKGGSSRCPSWQVPITTSSPSDAHRQLWDLADGRSVGRLSSAVSPNNTFALAVHLLRSLLCSQRRVLEGDRGGRLWETLTILKAAEMMVFNE